MLIYMMSMFMMVVGGAEWDAKEKNQKSKPLSQDTGGEKKQTKPIKKEKKTEGHRRWASNVYHLLIFSRGDLFL